MIPHEHQILAPTLIRSQMLTLLYQQVRRAEMTTKDAERRLDSVRGLPIRLLGDRVPAERLEVRRSARLARHTFDAVQLTLSELQADALITLDARLADIAKELVTIAPTKALS